MSLTVVDGGLLSPTNGQFYSMKNRIINGAMVIDQRNAGASVTNGAGSSYTLDRWKIYGSQASKFTVQQNAGSVTPPSGFPNYLGVTSSSAYSVGSTDIFQLYQNIEGFNTADLGWGTANAKTVTISFQLYSSLTGTFAGYIQNNAGNRSYIFNYTVSSANTWTSVSVTIAGDTTGTWVGATNGVGMTVALSLGAGSTYNGTASAWATGDFRTTSGATSVVGTSGATFYITGVQLEKGSTATSFDYRPYGTELQLCQRYYEKFFPQGVAPANGSTEATIQSGFNGWVAFSTTDVRCHLYKFSVVKRTTPTMTIYSSGSSGVTSGNLGLYRSGWSNATITDTYVSDLEFSFAASNSGLTIGNSYLINGSFTASAEL